MITNIISKSKTLKSTFVKYFKDAVMSIRVAATKIALRNMRDDEDHPPETSLEISLRDELRKLRKEKNSTDETEGVKEENCSSRLLSFLFLSWKRKFFLLFKL